MKQTRENRKTVCTTYGKERPWGRTRLWGKKKSHVNLAVGHPKRERRFSPENNLASRKT